MKLRISNGSSFAVEFTASTAAEFRRALRRAALQYFAREGADAHAELHVATDGGSWLSANYHRGSNAPYRIRFGQVDRAEFEAPAGANRAGTWFEHELAALTNFVQQA